MRKTGNAYGGDQNPSRNVNTTSDAEDIAPMRQEMAGMQQGIIAGVAVAPVANTQLSGSVSDEEHTTASKTRKNSRAQ